jgi:hypothetical protein
MPLRHRKQASNYFILFEGRMPENIADIGANVVRHAARRRAATSSPRSRFVRARPTNRCTGRSCWQNLR